MQIANGLTPQRRPSRVCAAFFFGGIGKFRGGLFALAFGLCNFIKACQHGPHILARDRRDRVDGLARMGLQLRGAFFERGRVNDIGFRQGKE